MKSASPSTVRATALPSCTFACTRGGFGAGDAVGALAEGSASAGLALPPFVGRSVQPDAASSVATATSARVRAIDRPLAAVVPGRMLDARPTSSAPACRAEDDRVAKHP